MKKKIKLTILTVLILVLIFIIIWVVIKFRDKKTVFSENYIMTEEIASLLSFTYYKTDKWEEHIRKVAKGTLNYRELLDILELLGVEEYIRYEEEAGFKKVSRSTFFEIYKQILDILDVENKVKAEDKLFVGESAKETGWLTQDGYEQVLGGLQYIRQYDMYRVYTVDDTIIGLEKRVDTPVIWENVFIHTAGEEKMQILFEKELLFIDVPNLKETISDTVCDIEWKDRTVQTIYKKEETIQGTVLSYDDTKIEIAGYGVLEHGGKLKIYKTYGTVEQLDESKLVIGNLMADFVVAEGIVCGIILKEPAKIEQIRVLLLNKETPYYQELYVSVNEEANVTFLQEQQILPANTVLKVSDYWKNSSEGFIKIDFSTETGNLFLTNEKGEPVSLGYGGTLEIRKYKEGYCIVNQLSLEEYLCAVVPSEMPASYELEALRAQAVCARSYACIQLANNNYANLGANVDDSTNYQVYNKQPQSEKTTLAVKDTVGEVIKYNGRIAEAYYYSTSCGFSQNVDVWNQVSNESNSYLKSVSLLNDETITDLSLEENFLAYIQKEDYTGYDSDMPYFRWKAKLDLSENTEKMLETIAERRAVNENHVQILDSNGKESEIAKLGKMQKLVPIERSVGGVLKKLQIVCENGSILITTEYNIRKILGAAAVSMTDNNGKAITVLTLLPSAAFSADSTEQGYLLYGGGYGHGIGMSQNGANGMAKAGFTYTDILQKFYQNIILENIYNGQSGI